MIRNLIFDMGEVLVHFKPEEICERCTGEKELAKTLADLIIYTDEWRRLDEGTLSFDEAESIFVSRRPDLSVEISQVLARYDEMIEPVEGMFQLVEELKNQGYRLLVLSNVSDRYWNLKKKIPALVLIDEQVLSCEEKVNKPDRKIYEILVQRYGLKNEECLFIDDRQENLVIPEQLGWLTHRFQNSVSLFEFLCEQNIMKKGSQRLPTNIV